ncbi:hypothetical protein ACVWWP_005555 [Bradyrhizobium sp. LM3.6]
MTRITTSSTSTIIGASTRLGTRSEKQLPSDTRSNVVTSSALVRTASPG